MEPILPPKFYGEKDLKHTLIHPHLGEGAYGCVISPPLNIENAKGNILNQYHDIEDTDVSKLFGDIDDCKKEIITIIKIYELFKDNNAINDFINLTIPVKRTACYSFNELKKIYELKPNNKSWLYCLERKKEDYINKPRTDSSPKENLSSDDIDKYKSCNKDDICEIVYSGAGNTLNYINLKTYYNFKDFIGNLIILINSLDKFNNKIKYLHRDIKPDNLLFNNNGKLSLIDYGLSIESDKIFDKDQNWLRQAQYYINPPEYVIYELLIFLKEYIPDTVISSLDNNITNIIKIYKKNRIKYENTILFINITQMKNVLTRNAKMDKTKINDLYDFKKKEIINYFLSLEEFSYSNVLSKIKKYPEKADIYSLGITLLYIYNNFEKDVKDKKVKEEDITNFYSIINKMIETDPEKRANHKEVINDLVKLYISMPGYVLNSSDNTLLKEIIDQNIKQGGKKKNIKQVEKIDENIKKKVRKRNINSLEKNCKYLSKIMILFKDNLKTQKTKPKWKKIITRPVKINNFNKLI